MMFNRMTFGIIMLGFVTFGRMMFGRITLFMAFRIMTFIRIMLG
jgi:hypothetical protein